jgi:hypothetical protein
MSKIKWAYVLLLALNLLFIARPVLAFNVQPSIQFDSANQQFYLRLYLNECEYDRADPHGNVTQYVTIPDLDRYAASRNYYYEIMVRGAFKANTTYSITVDGKICNQSGSYSGSVATPAYPPTVEFLSKGLYFSKINPYLRFRHRETSSIHWKIYRIGKENRYLFSRTEDVKLGTMQTTGESDTTSRDTQSNYYDDQGFRFLEDYPGKVFETRSDVEKTSDWALDSLDLTPYYKEGDWLVIVADTKVPAKSEANANEGTDTEANTEADTESEAEVEEDTETNENTLRAPTKFNKIIQFTNLGVYLRKSEEGLWGQTLALDTGSPVFAKILLEQRNGEILYEADTDENGWFRLNWSDLDEETQERTSLLHRIEAVRGEDSVEIFLSEQPLPIESFPISGESHEVPFQAFVYSDRGLYRLGDTVHLTTLIRNWDLTVPEEDLTSELTLEGPAGKVKRITLNSSEFQDGGATWSWSIPDDAKTGKYRVEVRNKNQLIGVGTFAIEQIIPPSIEGAVELQELHVTWDTEKSQLSPITGSVTSKFLFGAPATDKKWEYRCVLEAGKFTPKGEPTSLYEDFVFEDFLKVFPAMTFFEVQDLKLDKDGKGTLECGNNNALSSEMVVEKLPGVGKVKVVANVFEEGGRSIQISQAIPAYIHETYPGIRPMFQGNLDYGKPADFQIIAIDPQTGKPRAGVPLKVELFEKDYWGWYYFHRWDEPIQDAQLTRVLRSTEEIVSQEEPVSYSITLPDCCDWELRVSDKDGKISSRVAFQNGWWWREKGSPGSPLAQKVTLTPDKESYTSGETALIGIEAPFDGELLLFHEKDGEPIVTARVHVIDRKAEYRFDLTEEHVPWLRLNAILLRTVNSSGSGFQAKRETPYRALGMVPIQVHAPEEALKFTIKVPEKALPDSEFPLTIIAQDKEGQNVSGEVWMTVAVVDEGILQLAKFSTPDPYTNLHKRPAYTNQWYDTLGQVIPYSLHKGESAFGGDQGADLTAKVQRVVPMAWWSGIVKTDDNGEITLNVPVHDYTGRVRIMVVGWQDKRTGSAEAAVPIFAPVDLFTSLPRVFGAFDRSQAVVEAFNNLETEQNVEVSLTVEGPLKLIDSRNTATLSISAQRSKVTNWNLEGTGVPGKAVITFFAKNQNGDTRKRSTELFMRPLGTPIKVVEPFLVKAGESHPITIPGDLEFAPGTGEWEITLSSSPVVKLGKHLEYLVSYPYGCIEQTSSRLFAMLMLKPALGTEVLNKHLKTKKVGEIDYFIKAGIEKLGKMQMSDGGFTYWLGSSNPYQYPWLNAYVAHLLWKARQLNYEVPDTLYDGALKKMKEQFTNSNSSFSKDVMAYSAFVLALNGQVSRSDLQWLVSQLKAESPNKQNVQLAMANHMAQATLTRSGYPGVVTAVFINLPEVTLDTPNEWWWQGHYFLSREAAFAAKLYTHSLAGDESAGSYALAFLDQLAKERYLSTHTISWALLAADQIFSPSGKGVKARVLTPDGTSYELATTTGNNQASGELALKNKEATVSIQNGSKEGNVFGYLTYRGWPIRPPKEGFQNNIELHRYYMTEDGKFLTPPFSIEQGKRFFVVLTARHTVPYLDDLTNVIVEDWLPAGFEVENQRLLEENALPSLPDELRFMDSWKTDYVDYLDDKIAVFGTLNKNYRMFVYPVRAISQGIFQLMPGAAEAMYIPEFRALTVDDRQVTITAPKK